MDHCAFVNLPWLYFKVGTVPTSMLFEAAVFGSVDTTGLRGLCCGCCWGGDGVCMVTLDTCLVRSWIFWTGWTFWNECTGGVGEGNATLIGIIWWLGTFGHGLWWSLKDDLADVDLKKYNH